ncbi:MAG TPA: hemolysin family protein [Candidatus Agrococcus pullicola]|uniref:Hemolysin family protein n=1 Tax=Candidatus Agrococcus pullicola TaxID=2838429 RepID=A0A9D2C967_9MICO|nr:hemolysin family protein [Candidatus Agrococcus pullicola]
MLELTFFLIAAVLIGLGAWLAACDAALQVVSRADLEKMSEKSRRPGEQLRRIADAMTVHSMAINFGRVLSEVLAAILVTLAVDSLVGDWWWTLPIAGLVMVLSSFVVVGASPRAVGRSRPDSLLTFSAPLIRTTRTVLGPLAELIVAIGDRITPGRARAHAFANESQLLSMVDEATDRQLIEEDERELIHSVFEFGETTVREVMVPRPDMETIEAEATAEEAMRMFLEQGLSRIPVIGEDLDDVVGILYLRDVVKSRVWRPSEQELAQGLARPAHWVPESKKADDALTYLRQQQVHVAMVVDEYGSTAGLVTLEDLVEELVGEIEDEYDRAVDDITLVAERVVDVSSRTLVEDLGDAFDLELDDDDVDTVGGLVQKLLGQVLEIGDVAEYEGLRFEVLTLDGKGRQTGRIRVTKLESA